MKAVLQGLSIMVTRPQHQATLFCQMLEDAGARAIQFPTIQIVESTLGSHTIDLLANINQQDIVIFTSSNAVHFSVPHLPSATLQPATPLYQIAAIGKKTANELQQQHIKVHILPQRDFNSEALLALDAMQAVKNKRVLIIKGEGGRSFLGDTLNDRGALVDYANVYQRQCPATDHLLLPPLKSQKIDIITLTSVECSNNLETLLEHQPTPWLSTATLLLGSERIHKVLIDHNKFTNNPYWIAENPNDYTMFAALLEWKKQNLE